MSNDSYKEYAVIADHPKTGRRFAGPGLAGWTSSYAHAKAHFEYMIDEYRKLLLAEVEKEDLKKTNEYHYIWAQKKDDKYSLVERTVHPFVVLEKEE